MSTTARFRRLAGAACLVLGPVLLTIGFAVLPWHPDGETELESLNSTAANLTATQLGDLLVFLGILAMVPATLAVMRAVGRRAPVLGLVGGILSIAGFVAMMIAVVNDQVVIALADTAALRPAAADALDSSPAWVLNVVLVVFLGGMLIGGIVLGVALLRSRVVPAWAAWAVIAAPFVSFAAHAVDRQAVDVASGLMTAVAYALLAQRVLATDDAAWEAGEVAGAPAPRGVTVGATS